MGGVGTTMSLSIRTNVASLNAQRNLTSNQLSLDTSLARLSSGFRITKAGDDAAGLGISSKLESQIRSYGQATRNANDGLSVIQASESALNEQGNILTRLRELAMQSASDGIGDTERGYVNKEAQALVSELERISQVTEYNGTKLLNGANASGLDFHVGIQAGVNDVINLKTVNATTAAVAGASLPVVPASVTAAGASTSPTAQTFLDAATAAFTGQVATDGDIMTGATLAQAAGLAAGGAAALSADFHNFPLAVFSVKLWEGGGDPSTNPVPVDPATTAALALVTATAHGGTAGDPILGAAYQGFASAVAAGNRSTAWSQALTAAQAAATTAGVTTNAGVLAATAAEAIFNIAQVTAGGTRGTVVLGTPDAAAGLAALGFSFVPASGGGASTTGGLGVAGLSLSTKASAQAALGTIDSALSVLSSARADLGATGNRLQSAVNNIQAFSESLSAANSRIKDVDVAEETSRMARSQILSQAGVSVLAQANQMPQLALKLLG